MKKRFSVDKAEWNFEREDSYKRDCHIIAYDLGLNLEVSSNTVLLKRSQDNNEIASFNPKKEKNFWYEAWLFLNRYKDEQSNQ